MRDSRPIPQDVHEVVRTRDFVEQIFSDMTPHRNTGEISEYFNSTAKRVILQVIQVLQQTPEWQLRDLINAFRSMENVRKLLKRHPEGGTSVEHLRDNPEGASTYSTILNCLEQFTDEEKNLESF